MDLKRLSHLVLLSEELNFSRAAERANLSQTAFSRSIQSLEDELGLRLFDRGTRAVAVSFAGRQLLAHARAILSMSENLVAEARQISNAEGGELHFGCSSLIPSQAIRMALKSVYTASKGLFIDISVATPDSLERMLRNEEVEFIVASTEMFIGNSDYSLKHLGVLKGGLFCKIGHPLASRASISQQELAGHPWIAARFSKQIRKLLEDIFYEIPKEKLPIALNYNDLGALAEITKNTEAILISINYWLQQEIERGEIVDILEKISPPLPLEKTRFPIAVIHLKGRTISPAARTTVKALDDYFTKRHEKYK